MDVASSEGHVEVVKAVADLVAVANPPLAS
jgi:hypothetical protein